MIIFSAVSPAKRIGPAAEFDTISGITLSQDDGFLGLSIIRHCWSLGGIISNLLSSLCKNKVIIASAISDAKWIDPSGESNISSVYYVRVAFTVVGLGWSFGFVVLNKRLELSLNHIHFLLHLGHEVVVSLTVIGPAEWVCPSGCFLTVG